jgi:hypothetical protein
MFGYWRAAAGEHEVDGGVLERAVVEHAPLIAAAQERDGLLAIAHRQHAPLGEGAPPHLERVGDIRQIQLGVLLEVRGEALATLVERGAVARGEREQLVRHGARRRRGPLGRLLEDGVRVGAAHAERVHRAPPRLLAARPRRERRIDDEGAAREVDGGVGLLVAEAGRDLAVGEGEHHLGEAHHAGRRVEVADVGLHRAHAAEADVIRRLAERARERGDLDRVAEVRARAVALDVVDAARVHARERLRLDDRRGLAVHRRREIARLAGAVVVDGAAADDGVDVVAVAQRRGERPEHHHARAAAEHGALRAVVERVGSVRRERGSRSREIDTHAGAAARS